MRVRILYKFCFFFFCIFFVAHLQASAQTGDLQKIKNDYAAYQKHNLHEKIYVHTDRNFYLCGEIIWFKIYLTNAENNIPLSVSKVAYIELLDKNQHPVLQGKIAMKNGFGSGSFYLPFSMASGSYEIRSYTSWMKNFLPDYFFKKFIAVINTTKNLDISQIRDTTYYAAQFFPEGGNLVNGLTSEVAFKAKDNNNSGADCSGVIVDENGDTVLHFQSQKFGMGHFFFQPQTGKRYSAIINFKDGNFIKKELPAAYQNGYVMHMSDTANDALKIAVSIKEETENNAAQFIYLIAQNSQHIDVAAAQRIENNKVVFVVNKDSLENGVTQLTIFNENKQPVCERLYFKRPKNKMLVIDGKTDQRNYARRSKVNINIATSDQLQNQLSGNLSVAVYRLDTLHQPQAENIYNYLWLSSNVKGYIENPDYYFKSNDTVSHEALDNLMLTQGWRKFDWENIFQNKMPAFSYAPEYAGHIITGQIVNDISGKPAANMLVYLGVAGRRVQLQACRSDSTGFIHFDMKDFYSANQIVVQTNFNTDSTYHLEIFSPFSEEYSVNTFPSFYVSKKYNDALDEENLHSEIANAYHENQLQQFLKPAVDSTPFFAPADKTYMLDAYTRFTTMEEVLREYVMEVNVRRSGKNYRLQTFNNPGFQLQDLQPSQNVFLDNPLVLLDGVPVFNINKIIAYDPLKVQKLEVVAARYHYGPVTTDGIVSFTTYKGNLEGFVFNPHALVLDYEGLQQQRKFYAPQYDTENLRRSHLPDFRDLLFWSPDIITNKNGEAQFSFYSGDVPGKYLVVLQGLAANGDAGSSSFVFTVK